MYADLPPSPPPAVQPIAQAPEWAFLAPRLDLKWGAPRDEAMAKLGAVFNVAAQDLPVPNSRTLRMALYEGTVQGFEQCAILVFFNEDRLFGAEVIIPPQATGGAADLFKRVYVGQLASSGDRLYNVGFTIRQAEDIDIQVNGAEICTPAFVSRQLEGDSRDKINRGVKKAEGFLFFKSGGLIHMQSTSAGLEAKNPLYQLGCLIVDLKGFDPAVIEAAKAQAAAEKKENREDRRRPKADADAADFQTPAFKALKARAERGERAAQKELAAAYVKGGDIRRDRAEAIRWCEKALAQGDASVAFPLATLYANRWYTFYPPFVMAEPTATEYARAAALYERAGKAGNAKALVQLAYMYQAGQGVKKDAQAYRRYMEQAARLGSPDGYAALAALEHRQGAE
ncbi:MAG: hypothetical protein K0Q62_2364, partial [Phenylobacterium sp.]|nr:hypothetical protein [Phenylobacterium sp.]